MRKALNSALIGLAFAAAASAGQFTPGLERYLADHPAESSVTVLLAMAQQADIATLDQQLRDNQAELWDRHEQVITLLQNTATESQAELLSELEQLKAAGKVEAFYSHWLVNGIVVHGDVATLRMLASRADVERAEVNLEVELIDPVERAQKDVPFSDRNSRVATPGIQAINADDVWNLLSVDGTGALVGVLDTGVDGTHPALSSRYRGNNGYPDSECWYDALGGYSTPGDSGYHGTHVMGTICGGAPGEEIGVAPGSQWIASNVIGGGTGSVFDNGVIASLEFMADPDGNPGTINDVPDVVQNSWGVNEGFSGYTDCDTRWWTAIDNCEAAGVCLTWSAGNEGSGSMTLRSPADRATSPYNCFSVGSLLNDGSSISSFSSRGPSGCGGAYAMKPEVMAPGSDIWSAQPGGGYQYLSGTSMAGPHVAGVVALMRAANPNVDVTTIKQILMDTAIDMGTVGEDNDYGHGRIDAYEAVLAVMSGYGSLTGTVTEAVTGSPISGVLVSNTAGPQATSTDGAGAYDMMLAADTYSISYEAFGYTGQTLNGVVVPEDGIVTRNVALNAAPTALLYGYVYDIGGTPVGGASVAVSNYPVSGTTSDGSGYYELSLPVGFTYNLTAYQAGSGAGAGSVVFNASSQLDFQLSPVEGFESGDFSNWDWQQGGTAPWFIQSGTVFEGSYAAQSGAITHNQTSTMSLSLDVNPAGNISFAYSVSSEANYDYLQFYIDGALQAEWAGTIGWTEVSFPVGAGTHTFAWTYYKDGSVSTGSDCAWVDSIQMPPMTPPTFPDITVSPASFNVNVVEGTVGSGSLVIGNVGENILEYSLSFTDTTPAGRDMSGSTLTADLGSFSPGSSFTLALSHYNASPDNEWTSNIMMDLPAGVSVTGGGDFTGGSAGSLTYDGTTGDGAVVNWIDPNGGYGQVYPGETATGSISLAVDAGFSGDISIPWTVTGDIWGADPHEISGTLVLVNDGPTTPPFLSWDNGSGTIGIGGSTTVNLSFDATERTIGVYTGDLRIANNDPDENPTIIPIVMNVISAVMDPTVVMIDYTATGVVLSWTAMPGALNYSVYEKVGNGAWTLRSTTAGTSYQASAASPAETVNQYRVTVNY